MHLCTPPPSRWGFGMGSRSELGGLILPPGSRLGPKSGFPGVSQGSLFGALLYGGKYGWI